MHQESFDSLLLHDASYNPAALQNGPWHEISYEDVAVTDTALDAIKQAARQILPRFVPHMALEKITVGDGLALIAKDLYWEEGSGKLFLCTEIGKQRYCLHIPAEHWEFRICGPVH